MSEPMIDVAVLFGSVEIEVRTRREGNREIGESRRIERDRHDVVVLVTEWEPTGAVLVWPEPPAPWWKFWRRR